MSKRLCTRPNVPILSTSSHLGLCLLSLLQPVRHCLHTFLSARDAAHLMRTSRSITTSLLTDYPFVDHVFFNNPSATVAAVKSTIALYARYHMRIVRMCLPEQWDEPLVDTQTGLSQLPPSLVALTMGRDSEGRMDRRFVVYSAYSGSDRRWSEKEWEVNSDREGQLSRRTARWEQNNSMERWFVIDYDECSGAFNQPIPPAALPQGLRYLQFNDNYNQPLQRGSIPDTVQVLQFGRSFDQPLDTGHLPASLTHLVFGEHYTHPLLPGVLPASLRRLHFGDGYDTSLQVDTLPSQLQQLYFGKWYKQPISPATVPPSVTHMRVNGFFNQPMQVGSIPHGVVHLDLGDYFDHPLLPGVLPTSLRELVISNQFDRPLQAGSLPDGLEVLAFHRSAAFHHVLQPGVIPASVSVVSMGEQYDTELVAGGVPETVRWLRLARRYEDRNVSSVLSPSTRVVWWREEGDSDEEE